MNTFYTVTDEDTSQTNSRSKRYTTLRSAEIEAQQRLNTNSSCKGVIILKAIKLVRRQQSPVIIEDITEEEDQ